MKKYYIKPLKAYFYIITNPFRANKVLIESNKMENEIDFLASFHGRTYTMGAV
jgi:hypothetical protein